MTKMEAFLPSNANAEGTLKISLFRVNLKRFLSYSYMHCTVTVEFYIFKYMYYKI